MTLVLMASYEGHDHSRKRANSLPENSIRKVTIQQTTVKPVTACVAHTAFVENNRRYPKVEFHDPSTRGHRGKHPVKLSRGVVMQAVNGFELKNGERSICEAASRSGERDLWEKAVRELELIITGKDAAMDNLSKVNRKLSEDIQWYAKTLRDSKDNLSSLEAELKEVTGDSRDLSWYEKVLREREMKIRELENQLKEIAKPADAKDRRSLELSQGAKSVLKNLELRKGKKELEKKVKDLEEELKIQKRKREKEAQNGDENNNNSSQLDGKLVQDIMSNLTEFQVTMEAKFKEKLQMVADFGSRLSRCILKFEHLSKKVKSQKSQIVEEIISPQSTVEVSSQVQSNLDDLFPGEPDPGDESLGGSNPRDINPVDMNSGDIVNTNGLHQRVTNLEDLNPGDLDLGDIDPGEVDASPYEQQLNDLKDALQKERKINDEIIERFLELEESNFEYQNTNEELRETSNLVDDLRTQNDDLVREISEIKERENCLGQKDSSTQEHDSVDGGGHNGGGGQQGTERDTMRIHDEQLNSLRTLLESQTDEMKELREKAVEDDELIEELRANFQREEKWSREMKKKYEWELGTNVGKDEHIEELQECLWTREKMLEQLQEQLEFEDKRCEELLEKLVASQKEAQEFEEITESFQKKLQEKDRRITEFCEQNDRDAVVIGTLTLENKQTRNEVEAVKKTRKNLEEELERLSSSLEAVEQNKEKTSTRTEKDIKELSIQLKEEEFTSRGKDEMIKNLRENIVSLSSDVEEMEFKMEETRATLEEELRKAKEDIGKRDKELHETSERYHELQEVCASLREQISQKEEQILETEAESAHQREVIETGEKQIEELRGMCGDTTRLNNKPALVYTEEEMNEADELLVQEKEISGKLQTQMELLENEVNNSKNSLLEMTREFEKENEKHKQALVTTREELHTSNDLSEKTRVELETLDGLLEKTREELHERNDLLEKTREELHESNDLVEKTREELHESNDLIEKTREESNATSNEILKQKDALISKENELESNKEKLVLIQSKVNEVDEEKKDLEATVEEGKKKLTLVMDEAHELGQTNEKLQEQIGKMKEEVKRGECVNEKMREELEKVAVKCLKSEEELRVANTSNVNLKYSLDVHISQTREQNLSLTNYEEELKALRKHIHEMDVLVSGFRNALEEAVIKESDYQSSKTESVDNSDTDEICIDLPSDNCKLEGSMVGISGIPMTAGDTAGTHGDTKRSPTTTGSPEDAKVTLSRDNTDVAKQPIGQHPTTTPAFSSSLPGNGDSHLKTEIPKTMNCSTNEQAPSSNTREFFQVASKRFIEDRTLFVVLGILFFVFLFGCVDNPIVSRKYLFVTANSVISLIMFVLWRYEVRRGKHFEGRFQEKHPAEFQENGYLPSHRSNHFPGTDSECQHCEDGVKARQEERLHYKNVKSSFQELHEKFLEAVESSSKDTLPIQELYNEYEKMKDEVEAMRTERLNNDAMLTAHLTEEKNSKKDDVVLAPKCNAVVQTLGRVLIIVFLCEIFYNNGTPLPQFLRPLTFLLASLALSHVFDNICARDTNGKTAHAGQHVKEIAREIDELNEIIDKEHELVTTQRNAIKALEKRLRKEFERRIKQRNVLLKKLKYKGKLEDLRELLEDDRDTEEKKGENEKAEKNCSRNNNIKTENDKMRKLQDVLMKNSGFSSEQPLNLDISFSPMFFLLGLPLTGIMLSSRHLALAALMVITQMAMFLKESKYINMQKLPKVFQRQISPAVMDTIVVLYACLLAVCLKCSQGIVVLITCSIVQLSIYWWNCYRLAKAEDTLDEISRYCLPESEEET